MLKKGSNIFVDARNVGVHLGAKFILLRQILNK